MANTSVSRASTLPMTGQCGLLTDSHGGHTFGLMVQASLFVVSIGVLISKKIKEERAGDKRTWFEFGLDGSKQLMGAGFIHACNMLISIVFGNAGTGDPCEWYWINIMIDTTLGVFIEYQFLQLSPKVLRKLCGATYNEDDYKTGEYWEEDGKGGKKVHWPKYFKQVAVWLTIVGLMKICMVTLMATFPLFWLALSHNALFVFEADSHLELIVVMIITPMVMNAVQFWLTDSFLKAHRDSGVKDPELTPYQVL